MLKSRLTVGGSFLGVGVISAGSVTFSTGQLNSLPSGPTVVGAIIRGAASQTANLQEWQDSAGNVLAFVESAGRGKFFSALLGNTSVSFGSHLNLQPSTATVIGAIFRGFTNQVNDLFQYQTSGGNALGGRNALAQIYTGSTAPLLAYVGGATTAASGDGTTATITTTSAHNLAVGDRVTVANVTPTGYNGTYIITAVGTNTISYANTTTGAQTVAGVVASDAQVSIQSRSAGTTTLLLRAAASQANNALDVQNSAGTTVASITPTGGMTLSGRASFGTDASARFNVSTQSATQVGQVIRGFASQSVDLLQLQDSAGTVLGSFTSTSSFKVAGGLVAGAAAGGAVGVLSSYITTSSTHGIYLKNQSGQLAHAIRHDDNTGAVIGGRNANSQIFTGSTAPLTTAVGGATTAASGDGTTATITTTTAHGLAVGDRVTVAGVTPTGYNATAIVTAVGSTTTFSYLNATTGAQTIAGTVSVDAQTSITSRSAATAALVVRGAASQASNLVEWQNSTGTVLARVNSGGAFVTTGVSVVGASSNTPNAQLYVLSTNSANPGLVVKGASGQSGNLQEWQDTSGTVVASIANSGAMNLAARLLITAQNSGSTALYLRAATAAQTADLALYQNSSAATLGGVSPIAQVYTGQATPGIGSSAVTIPTQTPTGTTAISLTIGTSGAILPGQTAVISGVTPSGYNGTWVAQSGTTGTTLVINIGSNPGAITVAGIMNVSAQIFALPATPQTVGFVVKGAGSQAANLFEAQDSSGTPQFYVGNSGTVTVNGFLQNFNNMLTSGKMTIGQNTAFNSSQLFVVNTATGNTTAIIRAIASQTADLQQWQNSAGTALFKVGVNGLPYLSSSTAGGTIDMYTEAANDMALTLPVDDWDDKLRFRYGIYEQSTDGSTNWTPAAFDHSIIDGRQDTVISLSTSFLGHRWTWYGSDLQYMSARYLRVSFGYVNPAGTVDITFESSADNVTWTSRGAYTAVSYYIMKRLFRLSDSGGDAYVRVTIKYNNVQAGVQLENIELLTYRPGNQGGNVTGVEERLPIQSWNGSRVPVFQGTAPSQQSMVVKLPSSVGATITNAVGSGTVVTYTTSAVHYIRTGQSISITGITPSAYNITGTIASVTLNTFTVANAATGTYVSGGTATVTSNANIQEWQDAAGGVLARIDYGGRFNSTTAGNFGGISVGAAFLGVQTSASTVAFISRGGANQLSDLAQYQTSGGTVLGGRNAIGQIYTGQSTPTVGTTTIAIPTQTPTGTTNITITTSTAHGYSVGQTVVIAGVTPAGYNGAWTAQAGTTGTTLVANIGSNPGAITVAGTVKGSAQLSVIPQSSGTTGLVVKGAASQVNNLQEWQTSAGNYVGYMTPSGALVAVNTIYANDNAVTGPGLQVKRQILQVGNVASESGVIARGTASQTGDLLSLQNSSSTVLGGRNAIAQVYTGSASALLGSTLAATAASASSATVATYTVGTTSAVNPYAVGQLLTTAGFSAETYFNGTWAITAIGGSSGAWTATVVGSGFTVASATVMGTLAVPAQTSVTPSSAGTAGIIVRSATSQFNNLQEWQNSSGSALVSVNSTGDITVNRFGLFGTANDSTQRGVVTVMSFTTGTPLLSLKEQSGSYANAIQHIDTSNNILGGRNALSQIFTGSTTPVVGSTTVAIPTQTPTGTTDITITTSTAHGYGVGQTVVIAGVTPSGYNGTWVTKLGTTGTTLIVTIGSNPGAITVAGTVKGSAQVSVTPLSTGTTGVVIKAQASQVNNLLEFQDSTGAVNTRVLPNGDVSFGTSPVFRSGGGASFSLGSTFAIQPQGNNLVQLQVKAGGSGQGASDLVQIINNAGTVIGGRNVNGQIYTGTTTPLTAQVGGATTATSGDGTTATVTLTVAPNVAVGDRITVAGITPTGYNGTYIVTAVSNTSPYSVSYLNATTGAQTVAGTVSADAQVSISQRSAGTIGLIIKGAATQVANLQSWQDSTGAQLLAVTSTGGLSGTDNLTAIRIGSGRNVQLASNTGSFAGGAGVVGIANAATIPNTNPTGGGVLYVDTGALKYIGTSGSAATIVSASGVVGGTTTNALVIKGDSGTTEGTDLYTFNGSAAKTLNFVSGTNLTIAETAGTWTFNVSTTPTNITSITGSTSTALTIKSPDSSGSSSQSVNITGGNATGAGTAGGNVNIDAGSGVATNGVINIGTASTSGTVTLGRSATTTTVNGNLSVAGTVTATGIPFAMAANATTTAGGTALAVNTQETAVTVTFPSSRFSVTPAITANTSSPRNVVAITSASSTGFTMVVRNVSDATGTTYTWNWIAVQMTSGAVSG